jgi:thiosulfate dehydrogenase (quinone)
MTTVFSTNMSTTTSEPHAAARPGSRALSSWELVAYAMLTVRFVQGFIYWGGGSRRFIYAPQKLDPHATSWMANKFQGSMPGAILGTGHIVDFLLHHFDLLYAGVIIFSAIELVFGLFLIFGFLTRLSALATIGLSTVLMLLFGWQGATCIDEWTMAACNFGMGIALLVAGSSAFSLDAVITKRHPTLATKPWFYWIASGPLPIKVFRPLAMILLAITAAFVMLTYNYYRGSILTPFHGDPTSSSIHHFSVSNATVSTDGSISFTLYLDGGTESDPAHVVGVRVLDSANKPEAVWGPDTLSKLPQSAIANEYAYNKFKPALLGLAAGMGARARITLPAVPGETIEPGSEIEVQSIDNRLFKAPLTMTTANTPN